MMTRMLSQRSLNTVNALSGHNEPVGVEEKDHRTKLGTHNHTRGHLQKLLHSTAQCNLTQHSPASLKPNIKHRTAWAQYNTHCKVPMFSLTETKHRTISKLNLSCGLSPFGLG